jgi:hypothetical protein
MVNTTRDQFRHSAHTKKDAARALMNGAHTHPTPAVYLAHVALECALKLRILIQNRAKRLIELKRLLRDKEFEALFSGTTGHNLHHLEQTAGLRRYLAARDHESLLTKTEWHSMGGQRPYSLRYGTETITATIARGQVQFAAELADLILQEAVW